MNLFQEISTLGAFIAYSYFFILLTNRNICIGRAPLTGVKETSYYTPCPIFNNTELYPRKESTRKKVSLVVTTGIFHLIILNTGSVLLLPESLTPKSRLETRSLPGPPVVEIPPPIIREAMPRPIRKWVDKLISNPVLLTKKGTAGTRNETNLTVSKRVYIFKF